MALRSALLGVLAASGLPESAGHGYIVEPPARNLVDGSGTGSCPHCGNGNGVCGDGNQWPSSNYYVGAVQAPQRTYEAGSVVQFELSMNVNHKGHHEFFICDRPISSDAGAVECLQKWPLMRVPPEEVHSDCRPNDPREDCQPIDPNYPGRWYHPPGLSVHRIRYRIPEGLRCSSCTLQWFWPTSNSAPYDPVSYSCYQKHLKSLGWTPFDFCGWACSDDRCPASYTPPPNRAPDPSVGSGFEEFRNCADIRVVGGTGAPSPAPAPQPPAATVTTTAAMTTTMAPTPAPQPEPEPSTTAAPGPTAAPGAGCVPIGDCGAAPWCDQAGYAAWCGDRGRAGDCPTPFCMAGAPSPEPAPQPTPQPTPAPQPMPVPQPTPPEMPQPAPAPSPTPSPVGAATCVATSGMGRGVTDADCARCSQGYQWWPCNEAALCTCSGAAVLTQRQRGPLLRSKARKQSIVALIQGSAALSRNGMTDMHEYEEL